MGSIFLNLLVIALVPVLKLLLISAIGVLLALKRFDILGEAACHHLNNAVFFVFGPALVGSNLAKTVTFKSLLTLWFMPVNILITFLVGSALGWVLGKVTRAPKHIKGLILASCSAGNLGAMPIIILPAMCKEKGSPFGAPDVCKTYGLAYASLSMAIGTIYMWMYVYNVVRVSSNEVTQNTVVANASGIKEPNAETLVNVAEAETTLHSMHPSPTASLDRHQNSTPKSLLIASSLRIGQCLKIVSKRINLKELLAPSTIGAMLGFFIGMIPPFRRLLFDNNAPLQVVGDTVFMLGDAAIPSMTLILGANLLRGLKGSGVQFKIIVGITAVRFIFLPLLGILIVKGAVRVGLVQSNDPLFQFILLLQFALPPAMGIGTITQKFGAGQAECSVIMLWTYALATIAVVLWSTLFLWLVG